jgi:DNA-directed RNA polymerase subunit RPC12/RpoP
VLLVRLGLWNRNGFHECPQCKSRSVWKADPYGPLEETLHHFLRLSPYRCARCDKRFMDSKIPVPGAPPRLIRRWLSRASRLLQRTPFDEALRAYSLFGPSLPTPVRTVGPRLVERKSSRSPSISKEPARVSENGGLRA